MPNTKPFKIAIVGAAGSGKTAAALNLTAHIKSLGLNCEPVLEEARHFIERCGYPTDVADQVLIGQGQIQAENYKSYCDIIVCDAAAFLAFVYSIRLKPKNRASQIRYNYLLSKAWELAYHSLSNYSLVLYAPLVYTVKIDQVRSWQRLDEIEGTDQQIASFLQLHQVPYKTIAGISAKDRLKSMLRAIPPKILKGESHDS